jgi:hypothetical protein
MTNAAGRGVKCRNGRMKTRGSNRRNVAGKKSQHDEVWWENVRDDERRVN